MMRIFVLIRSLLRPLSTINPTLLTGYVLEDKGMDYKLISYRVKRTKIREFVPYGMNSIRARKLWGISKGEGKVGRRCP
ncbi:hypothetical protein N781_02920 [Pontibacillus halophilus JSM 076056 = DSM 19796]|uniref:Uncharacterized protein n=1 Tax=Pontibacillus halophilus JSM 076056 = DSM 19796 TaxID=1385510 RepID=A0A0A5GLI0_9BACI|nr:hypothetical protein N781_02920 [Pontibacillus halophilus JSM 076056 = DSM 19796]